MKHFYLITICMAWIYFPGYAQKDYDIRLKSGQVPAWDFHSLEKSQSVTKASIPFNGHYYLILQFEDLPSARDREVLEGKGVYLEGYLPKLAFLAKVSEEAPLEEVKARAIIPMRPVYKLNEALANGYYPPASISDNYISLLVLPYPSVSAAALESDLHENGFRKTYFYQGNLYVTCPVEKILDLAAHPALMYLEPIEPEPVKEGMGGRTLHRVNGFSGAYDGSGVIMAIADDGTVSHLDFQGRIYDHTTIDVGNHGEMTVGLAIGAGNIDPQGIGMAPAAKLHLYDIGNYPHVNNAAANYLQYGTVITSTSYGEGCGGTYSYSAQNLDQQVIENQALLHCFSAGNSSAFACGPYSEAGAINGVYYGNLTGGRKAAKHSIAVGNLFYNDELRSTSSRGPAIDGRIKPDVCAFGQGNWTTDTDNEYRSSGGTSAASPVVAGLAALLYEAFREFHNGANPASALIKANLLNTAEDLGRAGPDYDFGWGRVNGKRALETLENEWHFNSVINHGEQNVHLLTLPPGVKELRAMVYWLDPTGSPQAAKALVNDLDFTMRKPGGQNHLPWVLSTAIHLDSLTKPAYPGVDRVNNMEQIRLENPTPGTYELKVKGHLVPMGPQEYYIVYHYTTESLKLTYPIGGEGFVPGETEVIRWDAQGTGDPFILEYAINGTQNWQLIANNIGGDKRFYDWIIPANFNSNVRLRLRRSNAIDISPNPFCIVQVPQTEFGFVSNNSARIYWPPVAGASSYEVFSMGDEYMEVIGSTPDTSFIFNIGLWEGQWFAARAVMNTGLTGRRSIAEYYIHTPCENHLQINLHFDNYPEETSWVILDQNGTAVKSGGPYTGQPINSTLMLEECLPSACYEFIIYDAYGDGMCCEAGNGSYAVLDQSGQVLASGASFGGVELTSFCLDATMPTLALNVLTQTNVTCYGDQNGRVTVAATGGTGSYNYTWSHGASGYQVTNLGAGLYTVTVNDGQTSVSTSISILEPAPIVIDINASNAECDEAGNGFASAEVSGGVPPYQYNWSNGATTSSIEDLESGAYSLIVVDANGCSNIAEFLIENTTGPTMTIYSSNASCSQTSNGWAFVQVTSGSGNYLFSWSNGVQSPLNNGLMPGVYTVTVTDANGCEAVGTANIQAPTGMNVTSQVSHETCTGAADGMVALDIEGGVPPYTASWSSGSQGLQLQSLAPGVYYYNINDSNGCTAFGQITIDNADPMSLAVSHTDASNGNNGSINLTVIGGHAPYSYNWSNGEETEDIYQLNPGIYSVTVTDDLGCNSTITATVEDQSTGYCVATGSNTNFEWIESIQIGENTLISGNNNGYLDHQNTPIELTVETGFEVLLEPGFSNISYLEHWSLWLDLNQDGDFEDNGESLMEPQSSNTEISAIIQVPETALPGYTKMRVAMKYGSAANSCGIFAYGEVEDIIVEISDGSGNFGDGNSGSGLQAQIAGPHDLKSFEVRIFPNPASTSVKIALNTQMEASAMLEIIDIYGRAHHQEMIGVIKGHSEWQVNIEQIPAGHYYVILKKNEEVLAKPLIVI